MSLVTLKREIDIKTLVGWAAGVGWFLFVLGVWFAKLEPRDAAQDREIQILQGRIDELEGGMDVQNGFMVIGKSKEYTKGAIKAMEAARKMREPAEPEP